MDNGNSPKYLYFFMRLRVNEPVSTMEKIRFEMVKL